VVKGKIEGTPSEIWVKTNPAVYRELAQRHLSGLVEVR
jgi:hypothetical protein